MIIVKYTKALYALLNFRFVKQFYSIKQEDRAIYLHFKRGEHHAVCERFKKSGSAIQSKKLLPLIAFSHSRLGDTHAEAIMKNYLELISKQSINNIIRLVENQAFGQHINLSTEYKYSNGLNNVGILNHQVDNSVSHNEYITKIITTLNTAISKIQKEHFFYENIRRAFPSLNDVTPERINFMCIKRRPKILCATYAKIDGRKPALCDIDQVIALSNKISSIDSLKAGNLLLQSPVGIPLLVQYMHRGITYKINHYRMLYRLKSLGHAAEVKEIVNVMQEVFIKGRLYRYLDKKEHFTFNHLDFHCNNVLFNPDTGQCYVVDWETYSLAPFGTAMANYFFSINASFETVYTTYLKLMPDLKGKDSGILSAVFVYRLLLCHIMNIKNKNCEQVLETILKPAAAYLEKLVPEITA